MNNPDHSETSFHPILATNLAVKPLEECAQTYWHAGEGLNSLEIDIAPPERPLELLEKLGPSPFERGGFPIIGFLATTYDKVSRFALERAAPNGA